jgi:uncharacterized protein
MHKPVFLLLALCLLVGRAFAQLNNPDSPDALRSAARALTVGDLLGLAELAGEGSTQSQLLLGLSFQLIAERDQHAAKESGTSRLAAYWLRQVADKGSAPAQYFLAQLDIERVFVFDTEGCGEVSTLLDKAIAQQYLPAMTALGHRYMEGGCGFKVDYSLALPLLKKASAAGDAEANYWLAVSYQKGFGVRADQNEANRWFLKGAEMGNAACQNALGINVAEGNGTRKNETEAVEWFRKGAEQGNSEAACNLAIHYQRGEAVARDNVLALMWGLISDRNASGGYYCLDHIEIPKLTKEQVAEATQRANAWLTAHHYPTTPPPEYTSTEPK